MADLENLLLEAAGRTGSSERKRSSAAPARRRRDGSFSDDGSDSRDEDSDEERTYGGRKPSGSQVPLKKRLEPSERDDENGSHEEDDYKNNASGRDGDSSDESDVGDDLYKDEEDRRRLMQMSELEREMILSERADKKGDKNLTEKIRSKRDSEKVARPKRTPPIPSTGVRTSARSADRAAAKDGALSELRAKRQKQQDPEANRKVKDGPRISSPIKRPGFAPANLSSSSQSDSDSRSGSESDGSTGAGRAADSDDDSKVPSYDDIKEVTIRRSKLAKWLMEPWFEEVIVGCFVRVGIGRSKTGSIYRLCLVRNVDAADPDRPYKLENKTTYKYLNVIWGNESSAARWQMAMVSDSGPTEEEYKQWLKETDRTGGRLPSKLDIVEKKEAIRKSNSYVYSAATVKQMLQEKKSATSRPLNVAAEKDRLRREMEVAQMKNDDHEVERIKARIQELEASRNTQEKDSKAVRLAEMNRRNRVENFKNASEMKPVKAGEAGYDPFSRRWTQSTNYFSGRGGEEVATAASARAEAHGGGLDSGVATTAAALKAAAGAGKLIDTVAPVDQAAELNKVHDFDLPISLAALEKFGGAAGVAAGYMARKQRIERNIGVSVLENDGRRHALTLTVSDYKRRRGLL